MLYHLLKIKIIYRKKDKPQSLTTVMYHKFFYLDEDENAEWANILLTNVNEYDIIEQ